jgi:hypothetical protein
MIVYIDDMYIYGMMGVIGILMSYFGLTMILASNYLYNRIKALMLKRAFCLKGYSGGGGEYTTLKRTGKWLLDKIVEIEIGDRTVTRMKNNTDLFIIHGNLGVTVSLEVLDAVANLDSLGYKDLAQAVMQYDKDWFQLNKAEIDRMLAEVNSKSQKEIIVNEVMKKGEDVLIRLQWINRRTLPLSIVYNWAYQVLNPQNNKLLTEQAKFDARQETQGLMTAAKLMPYLFIFAVLIGVITFALVVLNGQGLLNGGNAGAVGQTTTTLAQTVATTLPQITAPTIPIIHVP